MKCNTCKYWNGTRMSKKGDCGMIIQDIVPTIKESVDFNGWKIGFPHDPHDSKYFVMDDVYNKAIQQLKTMDLPDGVSLQISKETDLTFVRKIANDFCIIEGTPRIVKLPYIQTNREYHCEHYKKGNRC